MEQLFSTLLRFCLVLSSGVHSQTQSKDKCSYQGDEDTLSFYQEGDVVLGGLFPMHFSPVSSDLSFRTKPKPKTYKLCVTVLPYDPVDVVSNRNTAVNCLL